MSKESLTRGKLTACKPSFMAEVDFSWVSAEEPWERLRWARQRLHASARAAAQALSLGENTYSAYEREPGSSKHSRLTAEKAMQFARKLKVRWEWLYDGSGEPWLTEAEESPRARVNRILDQAAPDEQERLAAALEAFTGRKAG